mmetsp:Transcript_20297/g.36091  ORF Transcript_20297/g.36091 Transcript_20297/m.36091 type:complete len:95 (+) Transcript_20297:141-425(+)
MTRRLVEQQQWIFIDHNSIRSHVHPRGHYTVEVYGCAYFSLEMWITVLYQDCSSITDVGDDDERLESTSCAMIVADGSCDEPRDKQWFLCRHNN